MEPEISRCDFAFLQQCKLGLHVLRDDNHRIIIAEVRAPNNDPKANTALKSHSSNCFLVC